MTIALGKLCGSTKMISALRKLCGPTKKTVFDNFIFAKIAAGPVTSKTPQSLGIMRRAGQSIRNTPSAVNHWMGTNVGIASPKWTEYSQQDGFFWHPSKSREDNLRGYAETTGEMVGGFIGGTTGFIGGGTMGGPAAPVTAIGGAVGGGYLGGKSGKGFGRNVFNWAWGSNGTQGGIDSLGRSTGYGNNNGLHGNDYMPYWTDLGYAIPVAGGALRVPLNNGLKPTLKPMVNHLRNLAGQRGAYTPVYESLPWWQRYSHGPNAQLHPYVNTAKPSTMDVDPNKWYHGRRLNAETGQFSGTNRTPDGQIIPDRNLRYQLADDPMEYLYPNGIDTASFLARKGMPRDSAERLLKNKGGIGAHFGKGYPYDYPEIHVAVPPNARPGWTRIEQPEFLDIRKLTDSQAATRSLNGSRVEHGRRMPVTRGDGDAPAYAGINMDTVKRELDIYPKNKALERLHNRLTRQYDTPPVGGPEFTIVPHKMPPQGYTRVNALGLSRDKIYPWKMIDDTPALALRNLIGNGLGSPYSLIGERALPVNQRPPQ